jgi:hypothetical protein
MRNISIARILQATLGLGLLLALGLAQGSLAQTQLPLALDNNYMVTGDYVVGGWTKTGSTTIGGTLMSTGTIPIPDPAAYASNVPPQQVPAGADIVAAFLYWQTVESSGVHSGQNGLFNNYPISGTVLGNPNAPVSWSSGGCAGAANGSKTIVTYRADVSGLIPVDANGNIQPNNPKPNTPAYQVSLPDTGKAGQPPFTEGATLIIVYRLLVPTIPLKAVVIYDGAYAPSNAAQTTTQPLQGFFQAGNDQSAAIATRITHIVANGQPNKLQSVNLNAVNLPSLYGTLPPFPGTYNGTWDNPTWFPNGAVNLNDSSATTSVVTNSSNKGCVSWGAIVMSTTVQDTDLDGLPDISKKNQGYCDAAANLGMSNQGTCPMGVNDPSWVALPGAHSPGQGNKDVFIQLDYMCTKVFNNADGTTTCDPSGVSYKPDPAVISNLVSAFSSNGHSINVHIVPDDNNVILAQICPDNTAASPPFYCPFPGQAGVVGWKAGFSFLKTQPLNYPDEASCETQTPPGGAAGSGPFCKRRFPRGQNNSYHEVIFGVAAGTPTWGLLDGSLTGITVPGAGMLTLTTLNAHNLVADPNDTGIPNGRVTIYNAISNPNLNGTYLVQSVSGNSFTIKVASGTAAPTSVTDPFLLVASGAVNSRSGVSDLGGADSLITLGLWGPDGQTVPVESGTFMHELGHSLGLTHGGLYRTDLGGGNYSFSLEPNCKSNFQSVMNYLFQVYLLDGALDYSEQDLSTINESTAATSIPSELANAIHPTTKWYAPNQAFGTPATSHCDGTALLLTDPPSFRLQGLASSITWSANQDLNFDGNKMEALQGYNDWANIDLRQIGASGNDFWAGGALPFTKGTGGALPFTKGTGGALPFTKGTGGALPFTKGTGGALPFTKGTGGVGAISINLPTATSSVANPTNLSAMLTASNTEQLTFTPPGFPQGQMDHFNVYRTTTQAFSPPAYGTVPVAGMPLPLPNPFNFTDTKVACATYSYFVTTVLSDGRESVPSNTAGPISVPCLFVGFLSPLSTASQALAPPTFSGSRNLGNAAPVKWELLDASNNPISDLTTLKSMQACSTTGPTSAPGPGSLCVPIYSPLTGGEGSTTFRFSSPTFIVNWDTGSSSGLTHGYWTLELQLSDGRIEWTNLLF